MLNTKLANETQIATLRMLGEERAWESSPRETQRYIAVMEALRTGRLDFRAAHAAMLAWSRLPFSTPQKARAAKAEKFSMAASVPQRPSTPLVRDPFTTPAAPVVIPNVTQTPATPDGAPEIPAGSYRVDGANYRVDKPEHGRWAGYTFVRNLDTDDNVRNATVRNTILRRITEIGPKDCAVAYGRKTHHCGMCGRELTNPESIAAGIGPICAGRF